MTDLTRAPVEPERSGSAAARAPESSATPTVHGAAPERDVGVVIVAAGASTRTGATDTRELKQFRWVAGKPMLLHSLQAFHRRADVAMVVCVLPRYTVGDPPPWIFQCDVDRLLLSVGGRHRGESVRNGMEDLPAEVRVVLVHDAARPLVDDAVVDRVVQAARAGSGAVPALPVVDTVKEVDDDGRIVRTVDRARLWRAQTPQGFPREMIERAYAVAEAERRTATDDAALCEHLGLPVIVVEGSERAIKITNEADFARVDALAALAT
ncbi:MAG TPA: 2-C-methyl-D-erythritol 4-phosphate cytidylyltransferase [Gemmatimonadaceae bacterium]|nr:2-C-methyl-D-erythritol 4-phosphate cytidylyltransferase [Gemmatimonadaceae bacterium]